MRYSKYLLFAILLASIAFFISRCGTQPPKKCDDSQCEPDKSKYSKDSSGQQYVKNQVVFSIPDTNQSGELNQPLNPKSVSESLQESYFDINGDTIRGLEYQTCPCSPNIILFDFENVIGGETTVVTAGNEAEEENPGREGMYSLNYLVNYNQDSENEGIPSNFEFTRADFKGGDSIVVDEKVIAILDSGIDLGRFAGDEKGFLLQGSNTCSGDDYPFGYNTISHNGDVKDDNGHGTMVALTYKHGLDRLDASYWLNNQKTLNVKVLDSCGFGNSYSISCGLKYAESRDVDVVNMSLGMYFYDHQIGRTMRDLDDDILIVCSGGNKGIQLVNSVSGNHYPSGMGNSYTYIDLNSVSIPKLGMENVFEVFSLDRSIMKGCVNGAINFGKADFSCVRANGFAEPGIGVQNLLNAVDGCEIKGTSFSAPLFSASTIRYLIMGTNPASIKNRSVYAPPHSLVPIPIGGGQFLNADWMEKCSSSPVKPLDGDKY